MKTISPPDWVLPPGVANTQWEYLSSESLAREYDDKIQGSGLCPVDNSFFLRHCPRPGITLDLGCGTGRLARILNPQGYKVMGVDLSSPMLSEASRWQDQGNLNIRANMIELPFLESSSMDYAACLFSSFGMVLEKGFREKMAGEIHRVLKPGGILILHVHNFWSALTGQGGMRWVLVDLAKRILRSEPFGNRTMPFHQGISGLTLHLFTEGEIKSLLRKKGFSVVEVLPLTGKAAAWRMAIPQGFLLAARRA